PYPGKGERAGEDDQHGPPCVQEPVPAAFFTEEIYECQGFFRLLMKITGENFLRAVWAHFSFLFSANPGQARGGQGNGRHGRGRVKEKYSVNTVGFSAQRRACRFDTASFAGLWFQ
ncbi:hypothetical protein, partial [Desulfovibrio sp.]|uniref:hypothetical protein n=1 Tax=Desulfovibrio sp. TaxID=885 RepID=UPI0023BC5E4B